MEYYENYCVECDWSASKEDHSTHELASLAIEHAVSTGHDIDSLHRSSPLVPHE